MEEISESLGVNEKITPKLSLKIYGGRIWTGFI
jgi:hypothetical protein